MPKFLRLIPNHRGHNGINKAKLWISRGIIQTTMPLMGTVTWLNSVLGAEFDVEINLYEIEQACPTTELV